MTQNEIEIDNIAFHGQKIRMILSEYLEETCKNFNRKCELHLEYSLTINMSVNYPSIIVYYQPIPQLMDKTI